jgi:drug/metabolite transporter (DMT)-like permease
MLHARWSPGPLLALLALGALGTGVAFVVTAYAAGKIGATRASSTAFLIPPVALLLGVVVRQEHVAPLAILGGAACVGGAWLMNRAQRRLAAPALPLSTPAPSQAAMGTRP